ncbi:MAG: ribose 1,5-bisphosphate isomerase [Chloroflexi bacterium RBG_13_48_17]|nr:MAG: ribose 1,5-bisphosphate isomerase [Chloroflexi bacterium RBG_13_48_17]
MDEVIISKAITESYIKDLLDSMEVDVAIAGAGPSGMVAGYYLAKSKVKVAIFERKLSVGGGMWGGGIMFNRIVVQSEAKGILDELGISAKQYQKGYYIADAVETVSTLCSRCVKAGAKIFNLLSVEDVMIRENDRITGLVLNWSAVSLANLHVDPLAIRAKLVIDATGHDAEICRIVARKTGTGIEVCGEKSMWAEVGEEAILENTRQVCPGLLVAGMAANAVFGSPRMGAVFGGMLLSGKKAAELSMDLLKEAER